MAKRTRTSSEAAESDVIAGFPHPRQTLELTGQLRLMTLNRIDHLFDDDGPLQSRLGDL